MPKAEGYQGKKEDTVVLDNEDLESGQRYGLMENERIMSGCKRFCFCYGFTLSWCEYKFIPYFLMLRVGVM